MILNADASPVPLTMSDHPDLCKIRERSLFTGGGGARGATHPESVRPR